MRSQSGFVIFTSCIKLPNLAQLWEDFPSNYLNVSSDSRPAHRSATLSQENIPENLPETPQENLPRKAARIGPNHLYCHISYPLGWVSLPISCPGPQPSSVKLSFICSQYILFTCHCPPPTPAFGNTSQRNLEQPHYRKVGKSVFYIAIQCIVRLNKTALIPKFNF